MRILFRTIHALTLCLGFALFGCWVWALDVANLYTDGVTGYQVVEWEYEADGAGADSAMTSRSVYGYPWQMTSVPDLVVYSSTTWTITAKPYVEYISTNRLVPVDILGATASGIGNTASITLLPGVSGLLRSHTRLQLDMSGASAGSRGRVWFLFCPDL